MVHYLFIVGELQPLAIIDCLLFKIFYITADQATLLSYVTPLFGFLLLYVQ